MLPRRDTDGSGPPGQETFRSMVTKSRENQNQITHSDAAAPLVSAPPPAPGQPTYLREPQLKGTAPLPQHDSSITRDAHTHENRVHASTDRITGRGLRHLRAPIHRTPSALPPPPVRPSPPSPLIALLLIEGSLFLVRAHEDELHVVPSLLLLDRLVRLHETGREPSARGAPGPHRPENKAKASQRDRSRASPTSLRAWLPTRRHQRNVISLEDEPVPGDLASKHESGCLRHDAVPRPSWLTRGFGGNDPRARQGKLRQRRPFSHSTRLRDRQ